MALPWVRVDTGIPNHDKILSLVADPSPKRWQALASYMLSIPWTGGAGTDGRIPQYALPAIQGTPATARLLVKHGLWLEKDAAWEVKNYLIRNPSNDAADAVSQSKKAASKKGNCVRHHGPDCGCWKVA